MAARPLPANGCGLQWARADEGCYVVEIHMSEELRSMNVEKLDNLVCGVLAQGFMKQGLHIAYA